MSTYINEGRSIRLNIGRLEAPPYLKEYLNYLLVVENMSPNTVRNYFVQIRQFLRWLQCRDIESALTMEEFEEASIWVPFEKVAALQATDIHDFLAFAQGFLGNSASTRKSKLRTLTSFFRYHVELSKKMDHYPTAVIPSPKSGKLLPKYLKKDECLRLLGAIEGKYAVRDFCIITFLVNMGMRLSELVGINMLDIKDGAIRLRGKGRKERVLYLNDACQLALDDWLTERSLIQGVEKLEALFVSPESKLRLTPRRVEQIVQNALLRAGLAGDGYTTHTLRHTAATLMYQEGGVDILVLQEILGHSSPSTTRIYTHLNAEQVRSAMQSSPLSNVKRKGN